MINGGTPTLVMNQPLANPASAPTRIADAIASSNGSPTFFQNTPSRIADNPMIEPTDRSIPPVTMIKVIGNAISPTSTSKRPWFRRLPVVRNCSERNARTAIAAISTNRRMVSCRFRPA